ncbi:solute carrier family member 5 [Stylonychia lemnae]|uniref:Solute carrier family member 5 n=1 Tax=Stylonychia lemnae TaxID=5949 RepID=A0A078AGG9_STYLE|nr:solute carrier family member 5 [Stylonychia lemnae]|eukprot:CDW81334.1 solute carrier family member 5 [Stylonychia lemnae]
MKSQEPPSPFLTSINNRDDFNSLINPDDDDDYERNNQILRSYLPFDFETNIKQQRVLAEHCFNKAGGFGRYQWFIWFFMILGVSSSALINQCMFLLQQPPKYECQDDFTLQWKSCNQSAFCSSENKPREDVKYRVDYSVKESLDNWFTTLNLECLSDTEVDLFHHCFIIGLVIGTLVFPRVGDIAGRKKTYMIGLAIHILLSATMLILREPKLFYAIIFLMGIEQPARFLIGYIYLSEMCQEKHRPLVLSLAFFVITQSVTFACLYFSFLSKHWIPLELIGVIITVIAFIGGVWIPESPRYLISKGQYYDAYRVFNSIARVNGKRFSMIQFKLSSKKKNQDYMNQVPDPNMWISENQENLGGKQSRRGTDAVMQTEGAEILETQNNDPDFQIKNKHAVRFTDVFKSNSQRLNFISLLICWCVNLFNASVLQDSLNIIERDTFVDYFITANAEALSLILSAFIYLARGGQRVTTYAFLAQGSFAALLIGFTDNDQVIKIFIILGTFANGCALNCIYLMTFGIFHTSFICITFGVMQLCGRLVAIAAPFAIDLPLPYSIIIFIGMSFTAAIVSQLFIREPYRKI